MSFLKGVFGKAKCSVGAHDWSAWDFERDGHCGQRRNCQREGCGRGETRIAHEWPAFAYIADDRCDQKRTCPRCAEVETRVAPHQWGAFAYVADDSCQQRRECQRCKAEELKDAPHTWGEWGYTSDNACNQARRIEHVWDGWRHESPTSCNQMRSCTRCVTEKQVKPAIDTDHRWLEPQRVTCVLGEARCERCSHTKDTFGSYHKWADAREKGIQFKKCTVCGTAKMA
jgi:hypothetical protein